MHSGAKLLPPDGCDWLPNHQDVPRPRGCKGDDIIKPIDSTSNKQIAFKFATQADHCECYHRCVAGSGHYQLYSGNRRKVTLGSRSTNWMIVLTLQQILFLIWYQEYFWCSTEMSDCPLEYKNKFHQRWRTLPHLLSSTGSIFPLSSNLCF